MPYDDPDPTDPQMLVGVMLPGDAASLRTMAEVFADEFARLGYNARQILGLFEEPFYAGAHISYRQLGRDAVREIVDGCVFLETAAGGGCGADTARRWADCRP